MRTIRAHAEPLPVEDVEGLFPGIERARIWLGVELVSAIESGRAVGTDWRCSFIHLEPDGLTIRSRADYVAQLRRAGVHKLAAELEAAVVPPGSALVLGDLEGASWTSIVSMAALLGEATS